MFQLAGILLLALTISLTVGKNGSYYIVRNFSPLSFVVFSDGSRYSVEDSLVDRLGLDVRYWSDEDVMSIPLSGRLVAAEGSEVFGLQDLIQVPLSENKLAFVTYIPPSSRNQHSSCCPYPVNLIADHIVLVYDDVQLQTHGVWEMINVSKYLPRYNTDELYLNKYIKLHLHKFKELESYDILVWLENSALKVVELPGIQDKATALVHEGFDISLSHKPEEKTLLVKEMFKLVSKYAMTDHSIAQKLIDQYEQYILNGYPETLVLALDEGLGDVNSPDGYVSLDDVDFDYVILKLFNNSFRVGMTSNNRDMYVTTDDKVWYPISYNSALFFPVRSKFIYPGVWNTDHIVYNMRSPFVGYILDHWWSEIQKYTIEDTLSLPYVLYQARFKPYTFWSERMVPPPVAKLNSLEETIACIKTAVPDLSRETLGPQFTVRNITGSDRIHLQFSCSALFSAGNTDRDYMKDTWPPLSEIPQSLYQSFTMNGKVKTISNYHMERQNGGLGYTWSAEKINAMSSERSVCGDYRLPQCADILEKYSHFVAGKRVLVFGSQKPWAEAALLRAGAAHVTTVEYMPIQTDHPQLDAVHPFILRELYINGSFEPVHFVFSFSSLEHDGLGRYGDPINPFGDFEALAEIHCLLKPNGVFFLAVPMGYDTLVWNANRVYGKERLAVMLMNNLWNPLDLVNNELDICDEDTTGYPDNQPIWVLQKR